MDRVLGRTILRGTVIGFVARVAAIALGGIQFLILAARFGAGFETDAYFIASGIFFILASGMEGTFAATFIPVFAEFRERHGEQEAWAMTRSFFYILLLITLLLLAGFVAFAPLIAAALGPGLSPEGDVLCARILRILSPLVVFFPLNALLSSIHFCYQRFTIASAAAVLPPLGAVSALTLLTGRMGILALPLGLSVMALVQFVCLVVGLGSRASELARWPWPVHHGVSRLARLVPPRFAGLSLMRLDLIVDRICASFLGVGYASAISYAGKLPSLTAGTLSGPLLKSFIPFLSRFSARKDGQSVGAIVSQGLRALAIVLLPLTVFVIVFGRDIVHTVFERGAFDAQAARLTAYPFTFYSLGLLFFGVNPLLRGAFFALQDTVTPLKVGIIASFLNVVLNVVLMQFLAHGGIALATTLVAGYSTVVLYLQLRRKGVVLRVTEIVNNMARPLLAAVVMGAILAFTRLFALEGPHSNVLVALSIQGALGSVIYGGLCLLLGVNLFASGDIETIH